MTKCLAYRTLFLYCLWGSLCSLIAAEERQVCQSADRSCSALCGGRVSGCFGDALDKHFSRGRPQLVWAGESHGFVVEDADYGVTPQTGWTVWVVPEHTTVDNYPMIFVVELSFSDPSMLRVCFTGQRNTRKNILQMEWLLQACAMSLDTGTYLTLDGCIKEVEIGSRREEIESLKDSIERSIASANAVSDAVFSASVERHDPRVKSPPHLACYSDPRGGSGSDCGDGWFERKDWFRTVLNCSHLTHDEIEVAISEIQSKGEVVIECVASENFSMRDRIRLYSGQVTPDRKSRLLILDFSSSEKLRSWRTHSDQSSGVSQSPTLRTQLKLTVQRTTSLKVMTRQALTYRLLGS